MGYLEIRAVSPSVPSALRIHDTVQAIRNIPLYTATGSLIHLSDVADVEWTVKDADSIARYNGEDTVTVSMTKNQSAGTIGMVNDVEEDHE